MTNMYVGEQAIGTVAVVLDTMDATATAEHILKDKTAYAGGKMVIGTHECATVADITADADAMAEDVLKDKTFYANGKKDVGTFSLDDEISEQDDLITQIATALEGKMVPSFKAICFSIAGTYYPAEEGMTWAEWCESDYNTDGLFYSFADVVTSVGAKVQYNSTNVLPTDTIISTAYTIYTGFFPA